MKLGKLDRRIVIQQSTPTANAYGEQEVAWSTLATVWAELIDKSGDEDTEEDRKTSIAKQIFRIRFRDDVTEKMRISYNSKVFDIRGIKEIGRERYLELKTEERS